MIICLLARVRVLFPRNSVSCRVHLCSATMKNHLPDRWTEYSTVGKRIPGTRFIAFKVPLKKIFDNKLAPWQRFSPTDLFSEVEKQNEELGLVVDLTCTKRYYAPQELPPTVKYAKIFTAGHQVPTDEVIHEFKSVVKQFLSENADNEKLVGVHCTHGLNRTGYLVCRFMIDVLGVVPSEAIEKFNKSRGHCIERKNYLDDLLQGKPRNNSCANPSWGPRLSTPPFSQLPAQYAPRPQHGLPQMDGRPPSFAFDNPGPGFPPPYHHHMPGPRHHIPHMEDPQQHHFGGGPQRHRHHFRGHFDQQQEEEGPMNGAPMWHSAPHLQHKFGGNMANYNDTRASAPQMHGPNAAYRRWRRNNRRGNPGKQGQ